MDFATGSFKPNGSEYIGAPITWPPRRLIESVDPKAHTMTETAFYNYIGRPRKDDAGNQVDLSLGKIDFKKFSPQQKEQIVSAYHDGTPIVVFGAPYQFSAFIAHQVGANIIADTKREHSRPEKTFNRVRQTMLEVNINGRRELWCFVFPSREYVDQVAEYINAIITDFESHKVKKADNTPAVYVQHFPSLESNLATWTGFETGVKSLIRYGDVVAIGHVEILRSTLQRIGFDCHEDVQGQDFSWQRFGINNIFGAATLVSRLNSRRIVMFGFEECFWGSASGLYVSAMIDAGARHILYGSKAATLVSPAEIAGVAAPTACLLLESDGTDATDEGKHFPQAVENMLQALGIAKGAASLTVPTVIGETKAQAAYYKWYRPVCMDCENGHISKQVNRFNTGRLKSGWQTLPPMPVQFLPLHFITDYIHTGNEEIAQNRLELGSAGTPHVEIPDESGIPATKPQSSKKNRSSEASLERPRSESVLEEGGSLLTKSKTPEQESQRQKLKREAFEQIGAFFGYYTHIYGVTDSFRAPTNRRSGRFELTSIQGNYRKLFPSMAAGYTLEAVAEAIEDYKFGPGAGNGELLAVALAAQKSGFLRLFYSIEALLRDETKGVPLSSQASIWLQLLKLKCLSQVGDAETASHVAKSIMQSEGAEAALAEFDQYHPFRRRLGLIEIAQGADRAGFRKLAVNGFSKTPESYQGITYRYFLLVGALMKFKRFDGKKISKIGERLKNVRRAYYSLKIDDDNWMHAHREKAAIAALFLEAAFYLKGGRGQKAIGLRILYLAHLLNLRYGGNERSEGYGEILWASGPRYARDLIALAMRRDQQSRRLFQSHVAFRDAIGASEIFKGCAEILREKSSQEQLDKINDLVKKQVHHGQSDIY
ncbi:hypothetical protein FLX27_29815 [Agrobacterium tumefaciens]|nr:hypothetical protein [Agrobacterium tumefaciens]TQN55395.1 hypothetical protein FLX27_29815 [Agrobacterium tumefaciens]